MAILASLPIVGFVCLLFSALSIFLSSRWRLSFQFLCVSNKRRRIFAFSNYDLFLLSISVSLLLIFFLSKYAGSLLCLLWGAGSFGVCLLLIVLYRLPGGITRLGALGSAGFLLASFFDFFGPASALNFDDDLAKYVVLPVGLRSIGTTDFGPLGPQMGAASLLSAGLQALYIMRLDLEWLAHWDIATSTLLATVWIITLASSKEVSAGKLLAACAGLIGTMLIVNVMYVNISAIYFPVLLFVIASGRIFTNAHRSILEALCIGLFAAIVYSFKENYVLLSGSLLGGYFFALVSSARSKIVERLWLFAISLVSFVTLAPGAASRALSSLFWGMRSTPDGHSKLSASDLSPGLGVLSAPNSVFDKIFNLTPTFYGHGFDSYFSINIFVFLMLISAAVCLVYSLAQRDFRDGATPWMIATSSVIGGLAFLILAAQYFLFSREIGAIDANIRYMMPSVLGLVLALSVAFWARGPRGGALWHRALICLLAAFLGSQASSAGSRFYQALKFGNVLAFPAAREPFMARHSRFVLGGEGAEFFANFQSLTPQGSTILAVIGFPSVLDFNRNRILLAEADGDLAQFSEPTDFLKRYSVDFIFWQRRGLGVRTVDQWRAWGETSPSRANHAKKSIAFLNELAALAARCDSVSPIEQMTMISVATCSPTGSLPSRLFLPGVP